MKKANSLTTLIIVSLLLIGCSNGTRLAKAAPLHHTENGFRNYPPTPGDIIPSIGFIWRRLFGDLPEIPPNHVISESLALSRLESLKNENSITWIGHATFLIKLNDKYLLTDPFFSKSVSRFLGPKRFVSPGLSLKNLPPIDFIIISHNHYDHLDADAIEELPNKGKTKVLVPLKLGSFFKERGYSNIYEMDWEEQISIENIKFTALPAIHDSGRGPFDENETLWCSWAIDYNDQKIYFAGDTGYSSKIFKKIGKTFNGFDYALLPIGAYEPKDLMGISHTTPEEAIQIGLDIRANFFIGMHWGTIVLSDEPPFEPPERFVQNSKMRGLSSEIIWIMKIGETRKLVFSEP